MTLHVAIDAMRHDASSWEIVSHAVDRAGDEAAKLHVDAHDLSELVARTSFLATYEETQRKVVRLLAQAADEYLRLCITLHRTADAYQRNDEEAAKVLGGTWDVRD